MKFCLIDFETASFCDLKKAGAWRYAEDPTTEILCLGYTIDGGPGVVRVPNNLSYVSPPRDFQWGLEKAVDDPNVIFIAHNVSFEKAIWRKIMMPVYGWPDIPNERWHDIMASCAMKALPLRLEKAAHVLGVEQQKDMEGSRVTLSLSRPNKKGALDRSPEKLARVRAYNLSDLEAELAVHRRVRGLGASERQTWLLDQRINERGVRLDIPFIDASQRIIDDATVPLLAEFRGLTGINPTQRDKFVAWLHDNGCPIPNLQKETIDKFLGDDDDEDDGSIAGDEEDYEPQEPQLELPFQFARALRIRKILGSASIKKLAAMRACVGEDGRARGLLQYHGAGTGRWAGRLFQPQNFPRPTLKVDGLAPDQNHVIDAINTRDHDYVRMMFNEEPIAVVSHALRHSIIASEGQALSVGDFAKIECVIVLALAGAVETAEKVLKMGSAVYTNMASEIFGWPVTKNDLKEYTIGKNSILGCGFQMGWKKFMARYWKDATEEQAKEVIRIYREDFAPEVPKLWSGLEAAAVDTVWTGKPHMAYGIVYAIEDGWLTARLPSGRKLWYRNPIRVRKAMPWDKTDVRPGFEYCAWKMGRWTRVSAYGGLLTENVVSGTARDLLVDRMFVLEAEYAPPILSVHDEAITDGQDDLNAFKQIMTTRPKWAVGCGIPVDADCWTGDRYRK